MYGSAYLKEKRLDNPFPFEGLSGRYSFQIRLRAWTLFSIAELQFHRPSENPVVVDSLPDP